MSTKPRISKELTTLSYIGLACEDLDSMQKLMGEVLGTSVERIDTGIIVRLDEQKIRIKIEQGEQNDIQYAGFGVTNETDLDSVKARLEELGYPVEVADTEVAGEHGLLGLIMTVDPDGLAIHVGHGTSLLPEKPFVSETGANFVTGDQGLGHIVLTVKSMDEARRFYEQGLGFKVSDFVSLGAGDQTIELTFLHCNPRHHTLALAPIPLPVRLLHFMLEVDRLDDVGLALSRAKDAGYTIARGLGRHTNDHMVSFYVKSPSGFDIEYGYGARTVSENWTVAHYHAASVWGHESIG
tara:strand:- start:48 stop:935 length:888 start_codon:yes stop_codon:yes gene_type:complete